MRWTKKVKEPVPEGSIREVRRFALFPTDVEDKIVWLEWYTTREVYAENWVTGRIKWQEVYIRELEGNMILTRYPHRKLS